MGVALANARYKCIKLLQVTGENGTMSAEYNFTTLPTVGTFPLIMVLALSVRATVHLCGDR